ncbi:hypothetical protein K1719_016578 [Acacia pycnantha]|nr:hypothetical protein K1719_016578 [Acacia pycnantha]
MQDKALQDMERLIIENMRDIDNYSDAFLNLASKYRQACTKNMSDKYFSKLPPPFNSIIKDEWYRVYPRVTQGIASRIVFTKEYLKKKCIENEDFDIVSIDQDDPDNDGDIYSVINDDLDSITTEVSSNLNFPILIGFTFPALPEPVRSTIDYPTLVRELINRNRDLEEQVEQLQKQLQQLKDNESVAASCIIDSGASRSCISPNAIPRHFYEEMYGQKFEMNKGKTPVKTEQGDSSEPTKEMMTFGSTVLVKYPPRHSKAFKPLPHLPTPDE